VSERIVVVRQATSSKIIARIPWGIAERAYREYVARYGDCQTLERLYERGGFYECELDMLYPEWRSCPGIEFGEEFEGV